MPVSDCIFKCLNHMFLPNDSIKPGGSVLSGTHHKIFHAAKLKQWNETLITFSSLKCKSYIWA
jgi:hypothetical protein